MSPARRSAIRAPACISRSDCSPRCSSVDRTGEGPIRRSGDDGWRHESVPREMARSPAADATELSEYSVPTEGLTDTPRAGNDSGGGQLGNAIKCKPGGPNDYLYVVVQEAVWERARQTHRSRCRPARSGSRSRASRRSATAARTRTKCGACSNSSQRITPSASSWPS